MGKLILAAVQKHEAKYDAASVDIQAVHAVMAYRLIDDRAPEVLKANTAVHAANDILQQRPKIKADVQDGLTTWLAKYGVRVTEVSIKDIRFNKDFAVQARAEGEAAALRLRAAAEAEYNAKVTQSLTATLIQQPYLAKWDGRLPQFVTGSGANLLMQIPTPGRTAER